MCKIYHHLTKDQRCQISTLLDRGDSVKTISQITKVDPSTVYRELSLYKGTQGYDYEEAHEKACEKGKKSTAEDMSTKDYSNPTKMTGGRLRAIPWICSVVKEGNCRKKTYRIT